MISTFNSYDYMAGFNTQEGSLIVSTLKKIVTTVRSIDDGATEQKLQTFLDDYLEAFFPNAHSQLKERFRQLYFEGIEPSSVPNPEVGQVILNIFTDLVFASPTLHLLDSHSKQNQTSTYMFSFTYESSDSKKTNPIW